MDVEATTKMMSRNSDFNFYNDDPLEYIDSSTIISIFISLDNILIL
jgi:hypothetical protein